MAVSQKSDKCFKCHESGHWAKNCPNNTPQGQVPNVLLGNESSGKCFNCQQLGHWAKNCPNNNPQGQVPNVLLGNESSGKCFNCQQLGHWAKNCPNNTPQGQVPNVLLGNESSSKCFNCQQLGHWAKNCPDKSTQEQAPQFSLGNDVIPPKMCRCRKQCLILTSKTFANPDRKYYKCYQCEFFQWCDDLEASASQIANPNCQSGNANPNAHSQNPNPSLNIPSYNSPNPSPTSPSYNPNLISPSYNLNPPARNPNSSGHEESGSEQQFEAPSILCECEAGPCRVFTAQTEKNKGRRFFKCHIKRGEGSCGFFKWCDQLDSAAYSVRSEPEESARRNVA